jgi:hypothetical protein
VTNCPSCPHRRAQFKHTGASDEHKIMRHTWTAALAGVLLLAAFACSPAAADANVTASSIVAPAGAVYTLNDTTLSDSPTAFTIQGTFTGASSARLAINCYDADGSHQTVAENVEGSAGSFSEPIPSSALLGGAPCVLRAVPTEDYESYPPGSASSFQGPTVVPSELYVSTFSGTTFGYDYMATTLSASHEFSSVGACGLGTSPPYLSGSLAAATTAFDCDGALYSEEPLEAQQSSRSEIQIDGVNAYGPYAAEQLFGAEPGAPSLTISREFDPSTGLVTIHETDPIAVCAPEPAVFPPTASSCSSFVSAGVSLLRTWQTEDSGAAVSLTDSWTSTDGAAHTLAALYDNHLQSAGAEAAGFLFPGSSSFSDFADGSTVTLPPGPGTIYYAEARGTAITGDQEHPYAAISYNTPPNGEITFTQSDLNGASESRFVMPYQRTIPAGGSFTLHMSFAQAFALGEAQNQARAAVAAYAPTLSIAEPTDGATLSTPTATVTGTVSYGYTLSGLTVDGVPVQLDPDGTWAARVTFSPGANTITATATGEEGIATSRSLTVTYIPPATLPETPPVTEIPSQPEAPLPPEAPLQPEAPAPPTVPVLSEPSLPEAPLQLEVIGGGSGTARAISEAGGFGVQAAPEASLTKTAGAPRAAVIGTVRTYAGAVSYEVACAGAAGAGCAIDSLLQADAESPRAGSHSHLTDKRSHRIVLGSASMLLPTGHSAKVTVKLKAGAERSLGGGSSPLKLTVTMATAGKPETITVRSVSAALLKRKSARRY